MNKDVHATRRWEVGWEGAADVLTPGDGGIRAKVLHHDPMAAHMDTVSGSSGDYNGPEHPHESSDAVTVLEGEQMVRGEDMRRGDFVLASGPETHGRFGYPKGCVEFANFPGVSAQHHYQGSPIGDMSRVRGS